MAPLILTLGRGALTGLAKRPSAASRLTPARLTRAAVRVDPARAAAYARVCGYEPGPVLPLTYPHILGFPLAARLMAARAFPLPLLGLVHTSIALRRLHALTVADRPDLSVRTEGLRAHRRGTEVVVVTEAHLAGELVWQDTSTYLARHRAPGQDAPGAAAPAPRLPLVETWELPGDLGRRHARVSGDYNPIHLSGPTARPFGFRHAIAHGMWTVARCAALAAEANALEAEFRAPVLLPSTVEYAAASGRFEVRSGSRLHVVGTVS
ncbi:MaoC/PaaZ C-terminal domain-containing protein [Streptomyces sp. NRRL F-5123]|uniref:MaoC/PaaZ C-terminal domain-containing protein n=1 Tax=Streptomyces sp. NRRL F-5123 TaxID=1463856 RepID=UPI0004E21941|nr:MaoC/PaaZ C-terminal domain-containing protein [Streptomyces sp. NRRL F-5123]